MAINRRKLERNRLYQRLKSFRLFEGKIYVVYIHVFLFASVLNHVIYRKVASSNMSRLEAPAGFFRLLLKGIFDPYVL